MTLRNLFVGVALMMGGLPLQAQRLGVEYVSEWQTNLKKCNWVNMLYLHGELPLNNAVSVELASISVAKTRKERLIEDLQVFSNVEEDNLPFALAVGGVNWTINERHALFCGIRNMNEDYFVSETTSFFTNSSCGVYPTISANYPIANYPLASVGVHYRYERERVGVQASLYNGCGYNRFVGRNNVFRFCPKSDGLFGLAEVAYRGKKNSSFLGMCGRYGFVDDMEGRGLHTTIWTYSEWNVTDHWTILAGYSHAFGHIRECSDFVGVGGKYSWERCECGLFTDYARFSVAGEWATELTGKFQVNSLLYVQAAIHVIITSSLGHQRVDSSSGDRACAGTLRLGLEI